MTQGWIKLHRQVRDHWLWQVPERLRAWIDLLFLANFEDRETEAGGEIFTVPRGSLRMTVRDIAERWGRSRHWVCDFLSLLQQAEMIQRTGDRNGDTITITNYDSYQDILASQGQERGQGGDKVGTPYKEEVIEESPYLLPEFEPSAEARKFIRACQEIKQIRVSVKGPGSVRPIPDDLAETFDKHARQKWLQVKDWPKEINSFREYWCTPDVQKGLRTFDYWLRFTKWLNKAVTGDGNRRPSGKLPPSGNRQRDISEFEHE